MDDPNSKTRKPPMHLLPHVLEDAADVMLKGAEKRGANDWREGKYELTQFTDAAQRHIERWKRGENCDPDSGQPHLVHAFVDLMMAHELQRDDLGTDDRWEKAA